MKPPQNTPLKKDWMAEAFAIANDLPGAPDPKKEHVKIVIRNLVAYAEQFKKLQGSLTKLFMAAKQQADAKGKPFPQFPEVMKEEDFLNQLKGINENTQKTMGPPPVSVQKPPENRHETQMAQKVSVGEPGTGGGLHELPPLGTSQESATPPSP